MNATLNNHHLFAAAVRRPGFALRSAWVLLSSRWKLRRCSTVGSWSRVEGQVQVHNAGAVHLGERVRIRGTHVPVELASLAGGVLKIGPRTFINSGVSICAARLVAIGENCAIGNYSLIMDSDFHSPDDHTRVPVPQPVIIEDDVWIGARATILKGVRIGRGAVVAAGAVVTKDVPAHTLVAGVPARPVRALRGSEAAEG